MPSKEQLDLRALCEDNGPCYPSGNRRFEIVRNKYSLWEQTASSSPLA